MAVTVSGMLRVPPRSEEVRWCDMCRQKGMKSKLRSFHINLTETVVMCSRTKCTYPLGYKSDAEQTKASHLTTMQPAKRKATETFSPKPVKLARFISNSPPSGASSSPAKPESYHVSPNALEASYLNCDPFDEIDNSLELFLEDSVMMSVDHHPEMDLKIRTAENVTALQASISGQIASTFEAVQSKPQLNTLKELSQPVDFLEDSVMSAGHRPEMDLKIRTAENVTALQASISGLIASTIEAVQSKPQLNTLKELSPPVDFFLEDSAMSVDHHSEMDLKIPAAENVTALAASISGPIASTIEAVQPKPQLNTLKVLSPPVIEAPPIKNAAQLPVSLEGSVASAIKADQSKTEPRTMDLKNTSHPLMDIKTPALENAAALPASIPPAVASTVKVVQSKPQSKMVMPKQMSSRVVETKTAILESVAESVASISGPVAATVEAIQPKLQSKTQKQLSPLLPRTVGDSEVKYLHWWNKDALCWLDVAMCILVHSKTVRRLLKDVNNKENLVKRIVTGWDEAQTILNQASMTSSGVGAGTLGRAVRLETSVGHVMVKTGGGKTHPSAISLRNVAPSAQASLTCSIKAAQAQSTEGCNVLDAVREIVWQRLQPKLKCVRGDNDSPVFALPLLLRESAPLMQMFMVHYGWEMTCTECGYDHTDSVMRCMPSFPNVTSDFRMPEAAFLRDCFMCPATQQRMCIKFRKMPPLLMLHFVDGLPHAEYARYDFVHEGSRFAVTAVIQYHNHPDHFIAWIRNPTHETWMMVDDLQKKTTSFAHKAPAFPASQIHIVMWERQSGDSPTELLPEGRGVPTTITVSTARTVQPASMRLVKAPTPTNGIGQVPAAVAEFTQLVAMSSKHKKVPGAAANFPSRKMAATKAISNRISVKTVALNSIASGDVKCVLPADWKPTIVTLPVARRTFATEKSSLLLPFSLSNGQSKLIDPAFVRMVQPPQAKGPLAPVVTRRSGVSDFWNIKPCTDANLSRIERLRLNTERLKALKAQKAQATAQSQQQYDVVSKTKPSSNTKMADGKIPATNRSAYLEALQPFIAKTPSNVVTQSKIIGSSAASKFKAFSFNNLSTLQSKPPASTLSNDALSTTAKPVTTKNAVTKFNGKTLRTSMTSQKAGKLTEVEVRKPAQRNGVGRGCLAKGKSKASLAIKTYKETNASSEPHIRGDPAARKMTQLVTSSNDVPTTETVAENREAPLLDQGETKIGASGAITETKTPGARTVEVASEIVLKPGVQSAAENNYDFTSATPNIVLEKNTGVDLFSDLNFDANIDFTDLDFNLDDFLI